MKDCNSHKHRAERILESIIEQLHPERINCLFEEPIKKVLCDFSYVVSETPSTEVLLDLTGDFLESCSRIGFPASYWHDGAAGFLGKFYQGIHSNGTDAALDDAFNDDNGSAEAFLSNLAGSLFQVTVANYKYMVYRTCIPPEWQVKHELALLIKARHQAFLPLELAESPAWVLVDLLPDLLNCCLQTENAIDKMVSSGPF